MTKLKPLRPTLRERKRYLAFEAVSGTAPSMEAVHDSILRSARELFGDIGLATMGLQFFPERYNHKGARGILRVAHNRTDELRAALAAVTAAGSTPVCVRSLGVSGIIDKVYKNYIAN